MPLLHLYVYGVALRDTGMPAEPLTATLLVLSYWPPMMAWELGRKVRAPEDETTYKTYSKVVGPRGAALAVVGCLVVTAGFFTLLSWRFDLPTWFLVAEWAIALAMSLPWLAFAARPIRARSKLKPWVEGYVFGFHAPVIAVGLV